MVAIQRISPEFVTIQQKTKVELKVKVLPLMPVSFTSFDMGAFENQLNAITVKSDEKGFASAWFTGTEGTIAECKILVACPETSGRVKFIVYVEKENLFK